MHNIVQKVLQTEAEAKRLVAAAKAAGEDILANARREAEELLAQARREAQNESQQMFDLAREQGEQEREKALALATGEIGAEVRLEEGVLQGLVEGVLRCVSGEDLQKKATLP